MSNVVAFPVPLRAITAPSPYPRLDDERDFAEQAQDKTTGEWLELANLALACAKLTGGYDGRSQVAKMLRTLHDVRRQVAGRERWSWWENDSEPLP